ncbi:MAG: hypothetical protein IPI90_15720 [Saprospiraceae bacterium]|nr:hypothetical protein [Candidatus Vicinibacter affinis]
MRTQVRSSVWCWTLKRFIQKEVVNELAKLLLSNDLAKDESITLDTDAKGFTFNGKSTGVALHRESDRKSQIDALTKATKDVEEASKKIKPNGKRTVELNFG